MPLASAAYHQARPVSAPGLVLQSRTIVRSLRPVCILRFRWAGTGKDVALGRSVNCCRPLITPAADPPEFRAYCQGSVKLAGTYSSCLRLVLGSPSRQVDRRDRNLDPSETCGLVKSCLIRQGRSLRLPPVTGAGWYGSMKPSGESRSRDRERELH